MNTYKILFTNSHLHFTHGHTFTQSDWQTLISIVNFLAFRALEQIRNDVILQDLNIRFIATGVNDYFNFLSPSHYCGTDDKNIMELINMKVFDPYEKEYFDFNGLVTKWITDTKAGYIRV